MINFGTNDWPVAQAKDLDEEKKLIEAGFEHIRCSDRDDVAICRKCR